MDLFRSLIYEFLFIFLKLLHQDFDANSILNEGEVSWNKLTRYEANIDFTFTIMG